MRGRLTPAVKHRDDLVRARHAPKREKESEQKRYGQENDQDLRQLREIKLDRMPQAQLTLENALMLSLMSQISQTERKPTTQ